MGNFFPVGKVGATKIYTDKAFCEASEGQECFDVTGVDLETNDLVEQQVPVLDGEGNPVIDEITQQPVTVLQKVFVVNQSKLAAKMVEIDKGAQITSYESTGESRRKYGSKLISITTGYTAGLNLSQQDSLALASSMNQIITLANLGRIDLAKVAIQAYVPDAYFTQEFKDLLLWDIQRNGY